MDPLKIFLNVLNAGFSASFFALAVMFLRIVFKKAPKAIFDVVEKDDNDERKSTVDGETKLIFNAKESSDSL